MARNKAKSKRMPSYILIGEGFDELEVVSVIHKFRCAGLRIQSVSLFDRLVYGRQGLAIRTDHQLADNPFPAGSDCLLILPAGGRNEEALRRDVRVRTLLLTMGQLGGRVAVTQGQGHLAQDVRSLINRPTYQPESNQDFGAFVDMLADRVAHGI